MKTLVLHYTSMMNIDLSYQHGWVKALKKDHHFVTTFVNLCDFNIPRNFSFVSVKKYKKIKEIIFEKYEVIIFLHSAFSNACFVPKYLQKIISLKKSYKVYFVGNEYKHMPEKIKFSKDLKINLFVTQSLSQKIIQLYKSELLCDVIGIPGGGLDTEIFYPKKRFHERSIDIGYRTYHEPEYFGHQERFYLLVKSKEILKELNFKFDLSMDQRDRFIKEHWANFINNCKSMIGTNTGFDYFEINDNIRNKVNKFSKTFKSINLEQRNEKIYNTFFKKMKKTNSMRLISGKNIEMAGCKTLQILVDGDYGNYFEPDIHYIKINKDLTNLEECFEKLSDHNLCDTITNKAYSVVIENLKYSDHLLKLSNFIKSRI